MSLFKRKNKEIEPEAQTETAGIGGGTAESGVQPVGGGRGGLERPTMIAPYEGPEHQGELAEPFEVEGGICAPYGFRASSAYCGIRQGAGHDNDLSEDQDSRDLSLIVSDVMCSAAAVYTTNKVQGAPIAVTQRHIADGQAQAIICNSGNANTCTPGGEELAEEVAKAVGDALWIDAKDIVVASTGVIGETMTFEPFGKGIPKVVESLNYEGSQQAAAGIMTTDTVIKEAAVEFAVGGKRFRVGGIAKGSGMIHPNMATMLSFITTDAYISAENLQKVLSEDVKDSFNQVSVDGDTSTNDMVVVLANGMSMMDEIKTEEEIAAFATALRAVTQKLARKMASDGEGAGKLIVCALKGARDKEEARKISKTVISSNLFKAAIFGSDANWGRVLCAIGYTEGDFPVDNIDVYMSSTAGSVNVCKGSRYNPYSEEEASKILAEKEIHVDIDMHSGSGEATAWGCDLTYEYVKINGDYRS